MIRATWWNEPNFGDALTPYLLKKLTGQRIRYCTLHRPFFKLEWKKFVKSPLHYDLKNLKWPETKKPVVMAVGSMLEHSKPNFMIWGTGFLRSRSRFHGGQVLAVRGKYSADKLEKLGFGKCEVFGDPAILLPLVYPKNERPDTQKVGIIPHYVDYEELKNRYPSHNVINLNSYQIEPVIDSIINCEYILSSSLHGLIVAHAYGIPALWVRGKGTGKDVFKFRDYFSSVGIDEYEGNYSVEELLGKPFSQLTDEMKVLMLPQKERITQLQRQLLKVAPFKLKSEFVQN